MYINFLMPILIILLFIKPLVESYIVPEYMDVGTWRIFRVAFIVIAICFRMMTFRDELQFLFNESYFLV